MGSNLSSSAMLKPTRLSTGICAALLLLALGCSDDQPSYNSPDPIPSIHPSGSPPPAAIPPNVSAPGGPISTATADDTISAALAEREMFARVRRLADVLTKLGPEGLDEAKRCLRQQVYHMQGAENVLLVRYWALHEPAEATRWAMYDAPLGFKLSVTLAAAELWAMTDPIETVLELQTLRRLPSYVTLALELGLVEGWFQSEQPGLAEYIRGLGVGDDRQRLLRFLARLTIEHYGAQAAIDWAVALPEDDFKFKLNAFRQLAMELGKSHPASGVAFCDAHCDGPYGGNLRKFVAQHWASHDGPGAMEWVQNAPEGQEKLWAVKAAFRGWFGADDQELFAWLDSFGPNLIHPGLQGLLPLTAIRSGKTDPERGLACAEAIVDPESRETTMITVASNWRKHDASSADAWLIVSPLSEPARSRVRSTQVRNSKPAEDPAPVDPAINDDE